MNHFTEKVTIFDISFSKIDFRSLVDSLIKHDFKNGKGYICFPDTSVITKADKNVKLKKILNNSLFTLPDGKPLEFYAKFRRIKHFRTISGFWLIKDLLNTDLNHFFYGSSEYYLVEMIRKLKLEFPQANITGFRSPPLIDLCNVMNNRQIIEDINYINTFRPDIIWVGLSSPKQDYLMYEYYNKLERGVMVGVGGVFDYLAGKTKISPEWIKKIGFRWLYRFLQEPGRLWSKYLYSILQFVVLVVKDLTRNLF